MEPGSDGAADWRRILRERLPLFGHRNWIVIADAAYPAQSGTGIETVVTGAGQLEVVEAMLGAITASPHVRPVVYVDGELEFVAEADAPGADGYRARLGELTGRLECRRLPHEEIIAKLDAAGALFRVLILKTTLAIPYTSVFVNLDCAYWSAGAEGRLRDRLAAPPTGSR